MLREVSATVDASRHGNSSLRDFIIAELLFAKGVVGLEDVLVTEAQISGHGPEH